MDLVALKLQQRPISVKNKKINNFKRQAIFTDKPSHQKLLQKSKYNGAGENAAIGKSV